MVKKERGGQKLYWKARLFWKYKKENNNNSKCKPVKT